MTSEERESFFRGVQSFVENLADTEQELRAGSYDYSAEQKEMLAVWTEDWEHLLGKLFQPTGDGEVQINVRSVAKLTEHAI